MQVTVSDISAVQKEMHIHVSAEELVPHFDRAYREEQSKIAIKGFRRGKAPLDLVKKLYGEAIEYDALSTIANDFYRKVAEERLVRPIGDPVLTDMNYKRGEDLSFKIRYEIKPDFELHDYRDVAVEKIIHPVTDAEVEDEVRRIQKANSTLLDAPTASDDEHVVTADVQELDHTGAPLIGKKSTGLRIYLADESVHPNIKEALLGVSVGAARRATIENDRGESKQVSHFEFTVKTVQKVDLPDVTSEFVAQVTKSKVSDPAEFRRKIHEDLEAYWKDFSERNVIDAIIREIVHRHDFTVPESMITSITDTYLEELKKEAPKKQLPRDFDEEKFRQEYRASAIFQAKWFLIREKISTAEHLEPTEAELEARAIADAPKSGIDPERLKKFYKSSSAMNDRIVTEKLMSLLRSTAKITEKKDTGTPSLSLA